MVKKNYVELKDWVFLMMLISIGVLFILSIVFLVVLKNNNPIKDKDGIRFYEIINNTNEWSEQYIDEEGYVRINTTRYYYINKGNEIEAPCECFEELCPFGSHWLDGSKVCYNSNKQPGIVDGIGCKTYVCNNFIVGVN